MGARVNKPLLLRVLLLLPGTQCQRRAEVVRQEPRWILIPKLEEVLVPGFKTETIPWPLWGTTPCRGTWRSTLGGSETCKKIEENISSVDFAALKHFSR